MDRVDEHKQFYDAVYSQDVKVDDGAHGWIQWKGTDVCMDVRCLCGHQGHVDADFFYFYDCPACRRKYAVGQNVKLIELNAEQIAFVENSNGFQTSDG